MSSPKCNQCDGNPEMKEVFRANVFDIPKAPQGTAHYIRKSGHPTLALIYSAGRGLMHATNHFFAKVTYKCPQCGTRLEK